MLHLIPSVLQRGFCPLHLAAKRGRAEAARTLLQVMRPENVNAVGRNGLTPLHMAAHYNHVPLVELLLGFGAEADRAVGCWLDLSISSRPIYLLVLSPPMSDFYLLTTTPHRLQDLDLLLVILHFSVLLFLLVIIPPLA